MAPDINGLPVSSTSTRSPRAAEPMRTSPHRTRPDSITLPPSATSSNMEGLPVRHSRPMTPAELHLELEKEQEAVVNRLTRELSALRAQTASVASNASSSSAITANSSSAVLDSTEPSSARTDSLTGSSHPTTSRHHRSSSSLSSRSRSSTTANITSTAVPIGSTSQASVDRARDAAGISAVSTARSRGSSAARVPQAQAWLPGAGSPSLAAASPHEAVGFGSTNAGYGSMGVGHSSTRPHASSASSLSSARLEEATRARDTLQEVQSENEALVRKVKELERKLRGLNVQAETNGEQERERGRAGSRDDRNT